jgi:hypothetical protein
MEKLRQEIHRKIQLLKNNEIKLLSMDGDKDYNQLLIITAKITAYQDVINMTYNN